MNALSVAVLGGVALFIVHASYTVATLRQALREQRDAHAELVRVTTAMIEPGAVSWLGGTAIDWHDDLLLALLTLDTAERSL